MFVFPNWDEVPYTQLCLIIYTYDLTFIGQELLILKANTTEFKQGTANSRTVDPAMRVQIDGLPHTVLSHPFLCKVSLGYSMPFQPIPLVISD